MSDAVTPKRTRAARESRADELRNERRRKPGDTVHSGLKLHVDKEHLDPRYEHRWATDKGMRVQELVANDYDPAPMAGRSTETRVVGFDAGKPTKAILMRKRKDWYEDDQKQKRKPLDEMEAAIKRGVAHTNEAELKGDIAYTPGTNTIERSGVSIKD